MNPVLLLGLLPFVSTLLGGLAALRLAHRLHPLMAIAVGVLVATALVDLLPESAAQFGRADGLGAAGLAALVGYLVFSGLEVFVERGAAEHEAPSTRRNGLNLGLVAPGGFIVHSTLDGVAIGLGFAVAANVGALVLCAVLAHDFADGANVTTLAMRATDRLAVARGFLLADALAPLLGVAISQVLVIDPHVFGALLGFFAGIFVAVGAGHLWPEAQHGDSRRAARLLPFLTAGAIFVVVVRSLIA